MSEVRCDVAAVSAPTPANVARRVVLPAGVDERAALLDELARRWRGAIVRVRLSVRGVRTERVGLLDVYAAGDEELRTGDALILRVYGRTADYLAVPAAYVTEVSLPKLDELRALRAGRKGKR